MCYAEARVEGDSECGRRVDRTAVEKVAGEGLREEMTCKRKLRAGQKTLCRGRREGGLPMDAGLLRPGSVGGRGGCPRCGETVSSIQ